METRTTHGYLVLADISGFTSFLATSELEHAHDVLSELLELIVRHLTPTLSLVEVEGDAIYVCAPEAALARGETLLELFESTYVAFKDRVEGIRRQTTCSCNACRNIPMLELKFIAHCGDYISQQVAGTIKLIGSDVNMVHRLSKNHISETTGWHAYALFSERTLAHMGVEPVGMHLQIESYEHLGEITTYSFNLLERYDAIVQSRRVIVDAETADWAYRVEIPAPPPLVWEWLVDPRKRILWEGLLDSHEEKIDGRSGVGMTSHCAHGNNVSHVHTIMDWRPFDYFTFEFRDAGSPEPRLLATYQLVSEGERTIFNIFARSLLKVSPQAQRADVLQLVQLGKLVEMYDSLPCVIASSTEREASA